VWSHRPVEDPDEAAVTVAEGETCAGVDFAVPHFTHRFGPLPLEMAISLLPREISAYEPLVARVSIATAGYGAIELADSGNLNWRIQVRDPAGNLLAITPRQTLPCRLGFTTRTITPWQDLIQDIVVSALYTFSQPGEYEIRIQRLRLEEHFPLDAEASARVTVLPFDRARLDARCRELAGMERSMDQFPWFYALCSVRRDVALPYLDKWVGNTEASHAILAIGSPAAKAKFEALAARQDHVGKTARYVRDDEATRPRYRWPSGILPAPWPQPSRPTR
jgi:hypothetical protein